MRRTVSTPVALLIGGLVAGVALPTAAFVPASAQSSASDRPGQRPGNQADRNRAAYPIKAEYVQRYNLGPKDLKEIAKAKQWAQTSRPRFIRQRESGGNYGINTGNGYYGAYQFAAGTWRAVGGARYASVASGAPKFAQDHMAYRLYKRAGWSPWGG